MPVTHVRVLSRSIGARRTFRMVRPSTSAPWRRARRRHARARPFEGCDAVYYLVHSIGTGNDFAETKPRAARLVRDAADAAGLHRIVYLGGMGRGDALSTHLASRHRVGQILASAHTPTTELRAAVIIGSGSISFEMLRYLTEVLPVMVTPRWVRTEVSADRDPRCPLLPHCASPGSRARGPSDGDRRPRRCSPTPR